MPTVRAICNKAERSRGTQLFVQNHAARLSETQLLAARVQRHGDTLSPNCSKGIRRKNHVTLSDQWGEIRCPAATDWLPTLVDRLYRHDSWAASDSTHPRSAQQSTLRYVHLKPPATRRTAAQTIGTNYELRGMLVFRIGTMCCNSLSLQYPPRIVFAPV